MRISNKQIKRIIQEEIRNVLNEADPGCGPDREGAACMATGTDPRAFGGGVVAGVCKQGKCVGPAAPTPGPGPAGEFAQIDPAKVPSLAYFKKLHARWARASCKAQPRAQASIGRGGLCDPDVMKNGDDARAKHWRQDSLDGRGTSLATLEKEIAKMEAKAKKKRGTVRGVEEPEEDIGGAVETGAALLRRPKKKKYKYSTAVKEMQMAMIFDPEIGKKLRKIMGKADGKLGPNTQKAVNYLRRHYKQKGEEVPRGAANVAKFLKDKEQEGGSRPRKLARPSDVSEYPAEAQGRKGGPVANGGSCKWRRTSVKAGTRGWSEVCGEGLVCIGYKAEPVSKYRWKGKCTVPIGRG